MSIVLNHQTRKVGPEVQERITALGIGERMQDLPEHLWHKSFRFYVKEDPTRRGGPNLRMIRLDPNKPSLTVTAYIFNKFVHPFENRFITPREAARLQGFPDEMEFKGTLTSVQQQVGNAVPIPLAEAIFRSVLSHASTVAPNLKHFDAISLFSGAGGMDIGAAKANFDGSQFRTRSALDNDKDCCESLNHYLGRGTKVVLGDIRGVDDPVEFSKQAGLDRSDIWLIYGGPPCQSFSQAGKQKGEDDPRGQLIGEFLRFVATICPRYFVMENVKGLKGIKEGVFLRQILREMERLGYNVDYGVLSAADFGTPQLRKRIIFIGTKKELGKATLPTPTHAESPGLLVPNRYLTVAEAFHGLPPISPDSKRKTEWIELAGQNARL
ncbi:DNA cytosine methyltransferase [Candidatus Acetothermia bacterium]|nr:DNA cytosine methyltransferase [Candidatus Acetothermia bacterium]MBI3644175.1 DNA cytosine methyltransferase [Candidatus Acetothermia bacterium]